MKAVIFDLDGTLLDTLEDLADAVNHALGVHGFPERSLNEVRSFVGNGAYNLITLSCPKGTCQEQVQQVFACFQPYYQAHCQCKTAPYQGCLEALEKLKQHYALAIVSNKPDKAVKALCRDFFPGIYALGERPDCPRKPAPDMIYQAMSDISARQALYVGDSEVDILTARNAGLPCLSVTWGFRDKQDLLSAGATNICENPKALVNAIHFLSK